MQTLVITKKGKYSAEATYELARNYPIPQSIKEILILREFQHSSRLAADLKYYYTDAKKFVTTKDYVAFLNELGSRVAGSRFQDFRLEDVSGEIKSLKDFKDKVMLIDFWFTGCGHCEDLYRDVLSKAELRFPLTKVAFISVSIDKNRSTWMKSLKGQTYTSSLATNLYTNGMGPSHPIIAANHITGYPTLILIDRNGKITSFNSSELFQLESLTKAINKML